jgi:hypothetical protein
MSIPIFIPFRNRPDLLQNAVDSIPTSDRWSVVVINNSESALPEEMPLTVCEIKNHIPLSFSKTQNLMTELARNWIYFGVASPFYCFMHSDACAGNYAVENLIEMAFNLTAKREKWGAIFTAYDAFAAFNTDAFLSIGGWDENLSWYASDCDVYYRLRLAGYSIIESNLPVAHYPSQTLKSDPNVAAEVNREFAFRESYYRSKWGNSPGNEVYTIPFNGEETTWQNP